eukprot:7147634-Prymnesium_polylepis.1
MDWSAGGSRRSAGAVQPDVGESVLTSMLSDAENTVRGGKRGRSNSLLATEQPSSSSRASSGQQVCTSFLSFATHRFARALSCAKRHYPPHTRSDRSDRAAMA